MMSDRVQKAEAFVDGLDLPPQENRPKRGGTRSNIFDNTKNQAMVIGADIVSFVSGTDPKLRAAIMNYSLLAQLAANCKVPSREDINNWYDAYFDILEQLGWVIQDRGFSEHRETGDQFETQQVILSVAATVLGSATTALAVVRSTLDSMQSMPDGPWMRIFQKASQSAKAARFQLTVAEPATQGGVMLSLMAFELDATIALTQVLFFKFRSVDIKLRHSSGRVTIDENLLTKLAPTIANKVANYVLSYVEDIPI